MKSFFVNAIMGAAAVQAVSVQSMSQVTAEAMRFSSKIKEADAIYVQCPYQTYRENRRKGLHDGANVDIDGVQVATAADKEDDDVNFLFSFEGMGLPDNTMRARLWIPTDADRQNKQVDDAEDCLLPTPDPTWIETLNPTNTDASSNVAFQATIPGTTFSLWSNRDIMSGTASPNQALAWHFEAQNGDGTLETIGCCFLEDVKRPRFIKRAFTTAYGPAGLMATPHIIDLFLQAQSRNRNNTDLQEWCLQQQDPSPAPAADVNVVDVQAETTDKASNDGTITLANSVMDGLSPTETTIPRIFSIAPVTTADGFCAGFDLVYDPAVDVDVFDSGSAPLVGTAVLLNDATDLKIITSVMTSPDQQSSDHLAVKMIVESSTTRDVTITEITCGRFKEDSIDKTNLICNPYSALIGLDGVAWASNGALTELTATSLPIFGGVSAGQLSAFQSLIPWYDPAAGIIVQTEMPFSNDTYYNAILSGMDTLTIDQGTYPVIDSIEVFENGVGFCTSVTVTYKNTTPASINYNSGSQGTSAGSLAWTAAGVYLQTVQYSDDTLATDIETAFNFIGSDGSSITCGNLSGSPTTVVPLGQTDAIPVFFEWDDDGDTFDGARVSTIEYTGISPAQQCIRDNNC